MKNPPKFLQLLTFFVIAITFTNCTTEENSYPIPETYNFSNADYSGQTTRISKLKEIINYIETANVSGAAVLDATKIKDMYAANLGNHYSTAALNSATSKQLENKTILSEQSNFENYMDAVAVASQSTSMTASNGQAGIATNNAGTTAYLLNANGIDLAQIIEKGLAGACFYYQVTAVYMSPSEINVDNNTINPNGTAMEHSWDEIFGYFGAPKNFPTTQTGTSYWAEYCNMINTVYPLNTKMMNSFLKGRAAITAKEIADRDEMILSLQKKWELLVVGSAIYFLNHAKDNLGIDNSSAYHELSAAFAFIMSIKYGQGTGAITTAQVDTILSDLYGSADPLQGNTYMVNSNKIEAAKTALTGYFASLASVKNTLK